MKRILSKTGIALLVAIASHPVSSQSNEIKVRFIGNCGMHLTDGKLDMYVDFPYKSGAHNYMEYDKSELDSIADNAIHLFTHRHADHYSKKLVKKLKGTVYGNWNVSKLEQLNASSQDFSIQAFKTSHKFTFKHYSYLITWHNKKIYINGDTGNAEPLSKIGAVDWAFVPWWLYRNAMEQNIAVHAAMFGIYHLYPFQEIPEGFPENIHFHMKQNEVITIPY